MVHRTNTAELTYAAAFVSEIILFFVKHLLQFPYIGKIAVNIFLDSQVHDIGGRDERLILASALVHPFLYQLQTFKCFIAEIYIPDVS